MTLGSFWLILRRQFTHKWGRFILASGGIMIGIWAITLTSSLSLGLSDTIIKAINSQPSTRSFNLYRTKDEVTNIANVQGPPKFVLLSQSETSKLKDKYSDQVLEISPSVLLNVYIQSPDAPANYSCTDLSNQVKSLTPQGTDLSQIDLSKLDPSIVVQIQQFQKYCKTSNTNNQGFHEFYESNRTKWFGSTEIPKQNEIASCFKCGNLELGKLLGANEPKDLVGKEMSLELQRSPQYYNLNDVIDVANFQPSQTTVKKSPVYKFKIISVVDDREKSQNILAGPSNLDNFYLNFSYYEEAIKLASPTTDISKIGFLEYTVFIKDYKFLDQTIKNLQNDKYLVLSIGQALVSSVTIFFSVLTIVLGAFGFIALVASIFGIINLMTISVLERKKEIGVLKSFGARDRDIFQIFLLESASLGFIGWLIGTLASLGSGWLISLGFRLIIQSNSDWQKNLQNLNIDSFGPSFPWWLLAGTLAIALFFTILSGIFPAINASKQNPVDVLRTE